MSSQRNNRKEKERSHIPFRLNLMFLIIFFLFVALIVRTGYLQIIKGEEFQAEVDRTESTIIRENVPRGEMYDSQLRPLVKNEPKDTIQYTKGLNTKPENMASVAYNLAYLIDIPHSTPFEEENSDLTIRDLKDYYYAVNTELLEERITNYIRENNIDSNNFSYADSLELISEAELMQFSDHECKTAAIFTKMNSAYALSTVNIKNENVNKEEVSKVAEYSNLLPGVSTATNWDRVYPQDDTMKSILGSVTTEEQGIPEAEENMYLARGYSRNDRVGSSQLEKQYETVLRGSKSKARTETDNQGDIINQEVLYGGSKGHNLILTLDLEFQENLEQIVIDQLANRKGRNNSVYAVAIDPRNGDVLGMSGKQINNNGEITDNTIGTIQNAFAMGSSVKGATVLTGYMTDAITLNNNQILDSPLRFISSPNISSFFNRSGNVVVNDIEALKYSSNVYMAQIAMRIGGYWDYEPNQLVPIRPQDTTQEMRKYFRQFGLGSLTGIDLPNESTGLANPASEAGQALFFTFGQFDTYTPMQLAQYSSVIANGGIRYAPKLVSQIRGTNPATGEVGKLIKKVEPKVMNHIHADPVQIERVQRGFYEVLNGDYGTGPRIFEDAPYTAAGKTGTAEAQYWDDDLKRITDDVTNLTFVGYAPYDNPEIAVAVVIPYLPDDYIGSENIEMTRQIFDAYFKVGDFEEDEAEETE